jgi:hypothetical protein
MPRASLRPQSSYLVLCVAGIAGTHLPCLLKSGLTNFLLGLALNYDPSDLPLPISWDYRCEPL